MIDLSMLEAVREAGMYRHASARLPKHNGLGLRSATQDQADRQEKGSEK
jgi:hypothetical protein